MYRPIDRSGKILSFQIRPSDSSTSVVRVRCLLRATGTAPLVGITMKAGYHQMFETTDEFARLRAAAAIKE